MVLQLANHSTRLPRGMLKDVLIKVGEFIFGITKNALINCRDGKLISIFGNMIMELNVIKAQKQLMGFTDVDYKSLNKVGDLTLGEVEVDYEE